MQYAVMSWEVIKFEFHFSLAFCAAMMGESK